MLAGAVLGSLLLIGASRRPATLLWAAACGAGALAGLAHASRVRSCPTAAPGRVELVGWFEAAAGERAAPFRRQRAPGCALERVWTGGRVEAGAAVRVVGSRRTGRGRGLVRADSVLPLDSAWTRARPVRWRGALVARAAALYGDRAPVVTALVLARREGLDPAVRDAFARTGIAHLLAISGFHVGVIAGLFALCARLASPSRRVRAVVAVVGTWAYVALLGFPDAASRAATILTWAGLAELRGRPGARWGPLGAAFLVLVAIDPGRLGRPGFQLSFAGAAGLLAWGRPLTRWTEARLPPRTPSAVSGALAAGVAATAATLPVVAWHFERVSLVGVPATLVASPLVALALPGAVASLALEPALPGAAAFLAGGVDVLLRALIAIATALAELPWASAWVPRGQVAVAVVGAVAGHALAGARLRRGAARRAVAMVSAAGLLAVWSPAEALLTGGTLELVVLDVGQGDAIAVRTPRRRWFLVDAGPPPRGSSSSLVRALRRRGVRRLEALVLTHADADHVGGAPAVLSSLAVAVVLDPGRPEGKAGYVAALEAAAARAVPWRRAVAGASWALDGVVVEMLHPPAPEDGEEMDTNDLSVVLLVRYGDFEALLSGDAPAAVERALVDDLPAAVEVLKVGHHGSRTSTDPLLLARAHPEVALVSVGASNRYGHPAPEVLARLRGAGVEVRRTDREGALRVVARSDGGYRVVGERPLRGPR